MEALGTLAGGVAHDLNNILSGIVSYPDLLLMDLPPNSPLKEPLITIKRSGEKATTVVQDLLTLARRGVATSDVVNLNLLITDYLVSNEFAQLQKYHDQVKIKTNLELNLLNIMGSPVHLSKTIMNLVSNAAEAMPEGGKISIETRNQYVDRALKGYDDVKEGDYVALSISDTGVGISPKDQKRIFEPYFTKKVMGRSGSGLGMAVVWGTVKDHKGYIHIKSSEGRGTTIDLYFPVTRKEMREQLDVPIENLMGNGEKILVVDDVKEQREIACRMLSKLKYEVESVSSGEKAEEYIKKKSADLLILDMIMDPGIDGCETYKRILQINSNQKAIIASGYAETDRVKEAQKLGAGQYIKKPYTLATIGIAIKNEISGEFLS
jgi:CheY-like chemotaxis protein